MESQFFKFSLILIIIAFFLPINRCYADNALKEDLSNPQATILTVINSIKKTKNPEVVSKYVDWDTAYGEISEHNKKILQVTSANQLKKTFSQLINNPASFASILTQLNPNSPIDLNKQPEVAMLLFETLLQRIKQEVVESKYQIGTQNISGERALIKLISQFQGKIRHERVKLVKKNDSWYLTGIILTSEVQDQ